MRPVAMFIASLMGAPLGCSQAIDADADEIGIPEGGGDCDIEYESLSPSDERSGLTAQGVVAEFFGAYEASLTWMADDEGEGAQTVEFAEKGTQTLLSIRLEAPSEGEVRWYSGGGTGGTSCAPRLAVAAMLELATEDGALAESVSVWFKRYALPDDAELDDAEVWVRAAILLELELSALQGSLELHAPSEMEQGSASGTLYGSLSFDAQGVPLGNLRLPVIISQEGSPIATGRSIELARW